MSAKWRYNDRAYLVPTLPTAPAVAYRQPACRVIEIRGSRAVVELLDTNRRLETHIRNLATKLPDPDQHTPPGPPRRPPLVLADNETQETLW